MHINFSKYHGTGNDFILIDDRKETFDITDTLLVKEMCSRRFGVGADGLILLREIDGYDFQMVYFNSDGNQSSMCGNGGRCIVHFAYSLNIFKGECNFLAIDGPHEAVVLNGNDIKLKMADVNNISKDGEAFILDTGSPHYVVKLDSIDKIDIKKEGEHIRYSDSYSKEGINVNFMQCDKDGIQVATYERGVEDETYSCGTGVTASAIAVHELNPSLYSSPISITTKGGVLMVYFRKVGNETYSDIWLEGPAVVTYEGDWSVGGR